MTTNSSFKSGQQIIPPEDLLSHVSRGDKDRGRHFILLQERPRDQCVVHIAVVKRNGDPWPRSRNQMRRTAWCSEYTHFPAMLQNLQVLGKVCRTHAQKPMSDRRFVWLNYAMVHEYRRLVRRGTQSLTNATKKATHGIGRLSVCWRRLGGSCGDHQLVPRVARCEVLLPEILIARVTACPLGEVPKTMQRSGATKRKMPATARSSNVWGVSLRAAPPSS